MILTGRCRDMFDIFLFNNYDKIILVEELSGYECHCNEVTVYDVYEKLPDVFKYGVLVDFFDNVVIDLDEIFESERFFLDTSYQDGKNHRTEARSESIRIANELYNEKFK